MSLPDHIATGSPTAEITEAEAAAFVERTMERFPDARRVLLVPPDYTRLASGAGALTVELWKRLAPRAEVGVLPATGTHVAMSPREIESMFPGIPREAFLEHHWRRGVKTLGEIPEEFVAEQCAGRFASPIQCEISTHLVEQPWDRIVSIGQLVPHEVAGIANHAKNIFIGLGGKDIIDKSHFLGAVCGMESLMGRADNPVRAVLNECTRRFGKLLPPITYLLNVRGRTQDGRAVTRGLFAGEGLECFHAGSHLCRQVNLTLLDRPINRAVVYLHPKEYKSTWLGNKAIYRLRMALADGAKLIVLAPGVRMFGEDSGIDALIRRFGYFGTEQTLRAVREHRELAQNLSAAAHLIHGSSEGRFDIVYCPGELRREEIKGAGYRYEDLAEELRRYEPKNRAEGFHQLPGGESFFFTAHPGQGLWALRRQFTEDQGSAQGGFL